MNWLLAAQLGGWLIAGLGVLQILPAAAAWWFAEPLRPFLLTGLGLSLLGGLTVWLCRPQSLRVRPRDGFFIVTLAWVLASLAGAIPYLASGALGLADALFESASGFTTTGSTVLSDIESMPAGLLLWRALTQWIGGMGIVVFTIALMPVLGIGGMDLFKAEVPGPVTQKLRPRVASTARRLWFIYVGLTLVECVLLMFAGMGAFDAFCHSLTTLSTGGFSTRNASIAAFDSASIEWIVIVFMVLAGTNFMLHYRLAVGRVREALDDTELHYFLGVMLVASLLMCLGVWQSEGAPGADGFRAAVFLVVSIVTTTGYASADYEVWSSLTHLVLLGVMALGAMSGSTSGGVKSLRAVLVFRATRNSIETAAHRNAVRPAVQYGGRPVPADVMASIWVFLAVYFALAAALAIVVALAGYDLQTAISAGLTAVSNVGPGLGEIGPFDDFGHFPGIVKLLLAGGMIAGRLELFTVLVLLTPAFWRR